MALKMQRESLADKISALITTKPTNFGSDDELEETKAKVVERYDESDISDDEFQQSKLRRQTVDTLDKIDNRYAGKKVSRKDLYSDEDNHISEDMESEHSGDKDDEMESISQQNDNELNSDEEADSQQESEDGQNGSDSEEQDHHDTENPLYRSRAFPISSMSETNVRAEIEKGNGVRTQLKLWENLLEVRIKLQKCLVTGNLMPQYDTHEELKSDMNFVKKVDETKTKLSLVLDNMLQLKDLFLKQYSETRNLSAGSRKRKATDDKNTDVNDSMNSMDEEIPSDIEDESKNKEELSEGEAEPAKELMPRKRLRYKDYEKVLQEDHKTYTEYRDSIIKKWNEKTRIAAGSLNKDSSQTTLKQIEFAMNDMSKLRKRTQLKRSEYNIVGKSSSETDNDGRRIQEYDPEIYDDDDFYHQLLRDLIEYKSSDMTDPIQLSKQWIQLQNMRRKMKRKIDTRATKGRRARYNVHNKLVNFMAPITAYDTWTDSAKNELYNSLFGKIKTVEQQQTRQ